jgi:protein O-mannosyl-transferase
MLKKQYPRNMLFSYRLIGVILVLAAWVYIPLFRNHLTNWDDRVYITDNPYIKNFSPENLKNIFTVFYTGNYHPLTLISLAVSFRLSGVQPWAYQLVNLLLHVCNMLLVYFFIKSLLNLHVTERPKASPAPLIAAALFGIHPMNVESVAWISERKNVLYAFFFLASLVAYLKYMDNKSYKTYTFSIVLFLLSLLSKGMAVPLSLCIIGIDYYAGRNLLSKKVVLEKIPYLLLSGIFGMVAIWAQHSLGAIANETHYSWPNHIAVASYGFVQYLIKLCFPYHLSAFYPYPVTPGQVFPYSFYASIAVVALVLFMIWKYFRKNNVVLFGTLFFIANISMVIQLLPVGDAIMADRYVYIAGIGIFFMAGYYGDMLWQKHRIWHKAAITALVLYGIALSVKTYCQVGVWKDSFTLWNNVLENYPENNSRGYLNRGALYYEMGKKTEACNDFLHLLELDPHNSVARKGIGLIKLENGITKYSVHDIQGALDDYNASLSFYPSYDGYYNRGVLKMNMTDFKGALSDFEHALKIDPLIPDAFINIGFIAYKTGNYTDALQQYNHALKIAPKDSRALIGRGLTNLKLGFTSEGRADLEQSAALGNTDAQRELQKYGKQKG